MKNLLPILSIIVCINLNAQNKRIAVSCDGNIHDRDDICAVSIELGIIAKSNLQSQVVYFGYSDHYWTTNTSQQTDEANSVINSANSWGGFNMSKFIDVQKNHSAAVAMLVAEINKSSATDLLVIAALGPMQVVGEAIAASNAGNRQYVTVVSHSDWNNIHAGNTGASEGLSLPRYNLDATNNTGSGTTFISNLGVKITKIKDQNATVSAPYSSYTWLQTASDSRLNLMWTECRTVANKSNFDCSDAGVIWFILKNDQDGSPSKLQTFFAGSVVVTPPPSTGVYYVSSSDPNASDNNSGTSQSSPWKTLGKVNSFAGNLNAGNQVLFKRGDIFFGSVSFTSAASGSASSPVVIGAYGSGNKPIITGLQSLSFGGGSGNIYTSNAINPQSKPKLLLINGQLTAIGRWPNANAANNGYLHVTSITNNNRTANTTDINDANWGSYSKPTSDFNGGQIAYRMNRFTFTTEELTSSTSGGTFHLTFLQSPGKYGYFIQNHIACLDQNTEWCYNANKTTSIYLTSSPSGLNIQMPVIDVVFTVNANYITVQDIVITGGNKYGISTNGTGIKINNCEFYNCGQTGAIVRGGNSVISNCLVDGSMKYGMQLRGNMTATDNVIKSTMPILGMGDGGNTAGSGIDASGDGTIIRYNKIYNSAYAGVNFHDGSNVFIQYNIVDGYCMRTDDGGAFYTVAQNRDFTFRNKHVNNNIIRHGENPSSLIGTFESNIQTYALYNDQWSNNIDWSGNVAEGGYFGWFANDPISDIVNNNLFYNIKGDNVKISNNHADYPITGNSFVGNVFFSSASSGSGGMWISKIATGSISGYGTINGNYYVRPYNNGNLFHTQIGGVKKDYTLLQWQGAGYGFETSGALSPKLFTTAANPVATNIYYVVNDTKQAKTIPLTGSWVSAKNISYTGSITLQPFTAEVLLWGTGGTPPPPVTPPIDPGPVTPPDTNTPAGVLKAKTKFIIVTAKP